jgi:hypothetical protein
LESAAGESVRVAGDNDPSFPNRGDAETWIGESWRELVELGVDQVRLFEDGREVYGPMSLHAP